MADKNIRIGLEVSSGGSTEKETKKAERLRDVLVDAGKAANNIGGTAGSRKVSAMLEPAAVVTGQQYGQARGVAGTTGAGARDFANQAQGLGGLVRLYATWAANIFAVGAAFTALENAYQKTRTLEAAEQLGNRVGISMKSLAKDLQEVSNFALSLEQATQFANLGISAGITGAQQRSLVEIATGAAAATGRDTGDAIRRIIQGTAKQEQEILDELGIFIKAKDAYEQYAKDFDVQGGADALSAQQKVVAYANAVEKAGEKWREFAQIEDPFAKFKARGSEAIFNILEVVNKILKPVLNFISETSGAIESLAILIGVKLTKQALPELGNAFKEALNFTKFSNAAKVQQDMAKYSQIFEETSERISELKQQQSSLLAGVNDPKVATRAQFAQDLGGRSGSQQRVTSAIFGTEKAPVDLTKYKSELDIQNQIRNALTAQVAAAADKEARLQKTIALGLAEKQSTTDNIVLSQKARDIAAQTFAEIQKGNAARVQAAAIQAEINSLTAVQEGAMQTANAIEANAGYTRAITASTASTNLFSAAVAKGTIALNAFKAGLGTASAASAIFTSAMQGGVLSQLKGFITSVPNVIRLVASAGVGLTGLARASALAGAGIGALSAGIGALVSFALGPLMIAVTVWQLFGDSIKRFLGITTEYDDMLAKLNESEKARVTGLTSYINATNKLNDEKRKSNLLAREEEALANQAFQLATNRRTEINKEIEQIEAQIKAREKLQKYGVSGTVEQDGGIKFESSRDEESYWKREAEAAKSSSQEISDIYKKLGELASTRGKIERGEIKLTEQQQVTMFEQIALQALKLERERVAIAERTAGAELQAIEKVREALGGNTDSLMKAFDKLLNKTDEFEGAKLFKNDTIREFAKNMVNTVAELQNLPATSTAAVKAATEGLQDYAAKATQAGVDMVKYVEILTTMTMLAENLKTMDMSGAAREAVLSLYNKLKGDLDTLQKQATKDLAGSRVNTGGPKAADPKLEKMPEFAKRISAVEKAGNTELEILKNTNDTALKLLDVRERGLTINAETAYKERNQLIAKAEADELQLLEANSIKRTTEYNRALDEARSVYDKNLQLAKGNTEARKKADEQYDSVVTSLVNSQEAFVNTTEKRIQQINTGATLREAENQAKLNQELVKGAQEVNALRKSYEDYWREQQDRQAGETRQREFTRETAGMSARERAGAQAAFNAREQVLADTQALERTIADLDKQMASTADSTELDKLWEKSGLALAQLRKLRDSAPTIVSQAAENALGDFDFSETQAKIQGFEDVFKNSFNSMADAFVTWAQTGEFSSRKLFNALLADLVRYELRLQATQAYEASRPLIKSFIASILPSAKGNAFDYAMPVQEFAKGGTFTNSIVDSPTLFKFAKGTGLMGEAGPEAIMPLKRDNNGNLGVRAQGAGGNVEVVVNNYSTAQATTQETRDDKGNRRVEVIIGEASSSEMARPGSSTQGAMRTTYGIAPTLIRR